MILHTIADKIVFSILNKVVYGYIEITTFSMKSPLAAGTPTTHRLRLHRSPTAQGEGAQSCPAAARARLANGSPSLA